MESNDYRNNFNADILGLTNDDELKKIKKKLFVSIFLKIWLFYGTLPTAINFRWKIQTKILYLNFGLISTEYSKFQFCRS